MTRRLLNIIKNKIYTGLLLIILILVWQLISSLELVPAFMLPSPVNVVRAFVNNISDLLYNSTISLSEGFAGLFLGIVIAFLLAVLMDSSKFLYRATYPLLIITQTIPVIAIAPLLVLWFGFGAAPKIILVFIVCFFPISIGLLDGFKNSDADAINLLKAMGASKLQIFRHIKWPYALGGFFSGLKISVSYSVVGAVIAEWLGGNDGLGVYMTRVRKGYAFDKMFAVILLIIIISLLLMWLVGFIERLAMPWKKYEKVIK
ncbi:MAG: ABC transporter permease [Bacillota bacterium]|nr:ABC transporter permease [Bacillota bacterium]